MMRGIMSGMEEFELTYLARGLPAGLGKCPKKEMLDIYLPSSHPHPTLRIRKAGDKLEMTKKEPVSGTDSSHQLETTIPLRPDEYAELSTLSGKRVGKTRYYYHEGNTDYEIDVFRGDLSGLVLVDVEFKSAADKARFTPPSWCLADVTQEKFVAGGMVCGKKYADIERDLARYGYKKIIVE
jgi:CYTH domain-containing protein